MSYVYQLHKNKMPLYKIDYVIECGVKYCVEWYCNNENDDNSFQVWYIINNTSYNKIHRENGAAIIFKDGRKEYWLNDICYRNIIQTDEEWLIFQII